MSKAKKPRVTIHFGFTGNVKVMTTKTQYGIWTQVYVCLHVHIYICMCMSSPIRVPLLLPLMMNGDSFTPVTVTYCPGFLNIAPLLRNQSTMKKCQGCVGNVLEEMGTFFKP